MEGEGVKMIRERRIVVAVDESEESMHALTWCLTNLISQEPTNILVLLYVKPHPQLYSFFDAAGYVFSSDVNAALKKSGSDLVHSVMDRAEAVIRNYNSRTSIERVVGTGEAKDVICQAVEKLKADTLVIGSHGYGFMKRALLGSVSDHCAKQVKCPVVIVKQPEDD